MNDEMMNCPRCGKQCWRDNVHNGVAMLYGPWGCECGWSEYEEYDQSKAEQPAGFTRKPAQPTPAEGE